MKPQLVLATVFVVALSWATPAFGFYETNGDPEATAYLGAGATCGTCHHPGTMTLSYGPHGGYLAATRACATCHTVHDAPGARTLLPGDTIKATCKVCHDGTGGQGVYGTIFFRTGTLPAAEHTVEVTKEVPGGNAATGGTAEMTFGGLNNTLTCSDCHSPHGNNTVAPFLGERQRNGRAVGLLPVPVSDRLLRQHPGGVASTVNDYGSDWCLACHAGRASGLAGVMNHPVESSVSVTLPDEPYNYAELGIVGPGPYPTSTTVLGQMGIDTDDAAAPQYNRGYLMPFPRTGPQAGHLPICQQCHEDTRNVGALSADGTQASPSLAQVTPEVVGGPAGDGINPTDNPRFQNFPHETTGFRLLVEASGTSASDDLCLNCHPTAALP